jgi:hypothetical protein
MKKIVLICGLIAGLIVASMMVITVAICYNTGNFEGSMVLGYATMLLAFSLIFIGIKNYRDKHNNGIISFGKSFKVGMYITLIASTIYVLVWVADYYVFVPDFMERYTAMVMNQTRADGASQAEIANQAAKMESYKEMYKNPLLVVLLTYSEVLPVGLVVTIISALILKRRTRKEVHA